MSFAKGFIDDAPLSIPCPECGHALNTTVGEARRNPALRCPGGHTVEVDASEFDQGVQQMEKRIDDMKRDFGD